MIYLIKQPYVINKYILLKVGYADDIQKRFTQYRSHCPDSSLVGQRPGNDLTERIIHRYLHLVLDDTKFIMNEWYQVRKEQYNRFLIEFHKPLIDIEKVVWESANNLPISDDLWEYLLIKYGPNKTKRSIIEYSRWCYQKIIEDQDLPREVIEFFQVYGKIGRASDRLKFLCETSMTDEIREIILSQIPDSDKVKYFYQIMGPDRCKASGYSSKKILEEIGIKFFSKKELSKEIYSVFRVNEKYPLESIKSILANIYSKIGYDGTPKATDLKEFFELKTAKVPDPVTKKRLNGYELIRKLL